NWGNTVILKHTQDIYSKLSHLKCHSVEVKEGDRVKQGQILGKCGNSGRSPYPHLHFQFQHTPYIGSPTMDYPFAHYLLKKEKYTFKTFSYPVKGQTVANPYKNELLSRVLHFIPGQQISGEFRAESVKTGLQLQNRQFRWNVSTDVFNSTYIECPEDKSVAYLYNNGNLHYFTNFTGEKESPLFWFFAAFFKVPLGFLPNSHIHDQLPADLMFGGMLKFLQDFIAPLYLFLKADYSLEIRESGDILSSGDVKMTSVITKKIAGRETEQYRFSSCIKESGIFEIEILGNDLKIQMTCRNELS
ncbi:MAG TPA: M23 family metallopeptidase, partial [Prolixibacteraceae bacterium]|nr:M23 family metallopeptidase [Prolixibacteraceae bacterium]